MKAWQFLIWLKNEVSIPMSIEGKLQAPSNSELRRWLEKKSVQINGTTPKPEDMVDFPVESLIFHPKGIKKCTFI